MIPHQPPLAGQLLAFRRFAQYALIHVETAYLGADWLLLAEGDMLREDFDGDGAVQAGVAGLTDLTHAPGANGREDLVGAEGGAGLEWHGSGNGHARFEFLKEVLDKDDLVGRRSIALSC